jgi:hypothetical protein
LEQEFAVAEGCCSSFISHFQHLNIDNPSLFHN